MRIFIRHVMMMAACLALVLFARGMARADPKLEMHRVGVSADDGSGWHVAVSTKGSFAIRTPIPFNDFTTHDSNMGEWSHVVGGKGADGIKFAAVESPVTARTPANLDTIPKSIASKPGNKVSDASRTTQDGAEVLSFSVSSAASTAYFKYIRIKAVLYLLSVEAPNAQRELAEATKDKFFGSFKLKGQP